MCTFLRLARSLSQTRRHFWKRGGRFMGMSEHNFERQFAAATRRGAARIEREPLAVRAKYDRRSRRIVIDLSNRCTLLLPPELAQGLRGASAADLSKVRLLGPGTTISWPALDVQFS